MKLKAFGGTMKHSLDKTDIAILNLLQKNARTPIKTIAEQVFISPPTVAARIDAMEKAGIILGYHAKISDTVLGHPVRAFINLEITPDRKVELYAFLKNAPEVLECSHVTGEYSVLIQTVFESTDLLDKFISKLQVFGRTKTQIVFSSVVEHRGFQIPPIL
jgi:Lrp/AsnC family leucine-responsive transcriptional regulator